MHLNQHSAQLSWEPPVLLSEGHTPENVSTDPHIEGYFVYVSDTILMSGDVKEIYTSDTYLMNISSIIISCSFSVQVAAVNPAGVGQRSTKQTINCELPHVLYIHLLCLPCKSPHDHHSPPVFHHSGCTDSTSTSNYTTMVKGNNLETSILSGDLLRVIPTFVYTFIEVQFAMYTICRWSNCGYSDYCDYSCTVMYFYYCLFIGFWTIHTFRYV